MTVYRGITVRRFKESVFRNAEDALCRGVRVSNLSVFVKPPGLASHEIPPLHSMLMESCGNSEGDCIIVLADRVARKTPKIIRQVYYELVDENGTPLFESPQCVPLRSGSWIMDFRKAVLEQIRGELSRTAHWGDLTVYDSRSSLEWRHDLMVNEECKMFLRGNNSADCCPVVVAHNRAFKERVPFRDIFYQVVDETVQVLQASPRGVSLETGCTVGDVRKAVFRQIQSEVLLPRASSTDLMACGSRKALISDDDQLALWDKLIIRQGDCCERSLVVVISWPVIADPLRIPRIVYDVADEYGVSLWESLRWLALPVQTRTEDFRDTVFEDIRSRLCEDAIPADLSVFKCIDGLLRGEEPLPLKWRIAMLCRETPRAKFVVMVANKALKKQVSSRTVYFEVVDVTDTALLESAGCATIKDGSNILVCQDAVFNMIQSLLSDTAIPADLRIYRSPSEVNRLSPDKRLVSRYGSTPGECLRIVVPTKVLRDPTIVREIYVDVVNSLGMRILPWGASALVNVSSSVVGFGNIVFKEIRSHLSEKKSDGLNLEDLRVYKCCGAFDAEDDPVKMELMVSDILCEEDDPVVVVTSLANRISQMGLSNPLASIDPDEAMELFTSIDAHDADVDDVNSTWPLRWHCL